ncbi:unnamed protein product [Amoebophrya sp. A25]|nr:unnamed protein product [Amoebophrya sp. A25]|eukprot:GSA25T00023215001.1
MAQVMLRKVHVASIPHLVRCCASFSRLSFRDDRLLYVVGRRVRKFLKDDETSPRNVLGNAGITGIGDANLYLAGTRSEGGTEQDDEDALLSPPPRFFDSPAVTMSVLSQLLEVYASYDERHRIYLESRATIARVAYYMHWLGVWHEPFCNYLRHEFLHSPDFEDECPLVALEYDTEDPREVWNQQYRTGGRVLHRLRQRRAEWREKKLVERSRGLRSHQLLEGQGDRECQNRDMNHPDDHVDQNLQNSVLEKLDEDDVNSKIPVLASSLKPPSQIRAENLSGLILARATTLAFSAFGHHDVRFLDQLLALYQRCLEKKTDKTVEFTQNFACKRFVTALVACRWSGADFGNLTLQTLRDLMPDMVGPAAASFLAEVPEPREGGKKLLSFCPYSIVVPSSKQMLSTEPEADTNVSSSVLHEEVSAAIEKVREEEAETVGSENIFGNNQAKDRRFEHFCGLYFVDTLFPAPSGPVRSFTDSSSCFE